jgi:hypothetical protein
MCLRPRRHKHERGENVYVRVIECNASLMQPSPRPSDLLDPRPVVSTLQPEAGGNERIVPQQAVLTFSTVVHIEELMLQVGALRSTTSLSAIDINLDERDRALSDLRSMGITDGSMFPGIEGTCRDLNQFHFGVQDE